MLIPLFRVQRCKPENSGCRSYQLTPRAVRGDLGAPATGACHMIKTLMYVEHDRSVCRSEGVFRLGIEHTHTHWLSHTYTHARTHAHTHAPTHQHSLTRTRTHTHASERERVRDVKCYYSRLVDTSTQRQRQRHTDRQTCRQTDRLTQTQTEITNHCWCYHPRPAFFPCIVVRLSELEFQSLRNRPLLLKGIMDFQRQLNLKQISVLHLIFHFEYSLVMFCRNK